MTGSVQTKNGIWQMVINYKDGDKYKKKWVSTGLKERGNKRKAEERLKKYLETHSELNYRDANKIKFTDYATSWLNEKKDKIELSTWESYYTYIMKHIAPYFDKLNLSLTEIKPMHVLDYYNYQLKNGRCDGKGGLSARSVRSHKLLLNTIFNEAVITELLDKNPALNVSVPKQEKKIVVPRFLNLEEANRVIAAFEGHILQPIIYITLYYGLRKSEVLGLKWGAIDFENDILTINHTVVKNHTIVYKDKTKTESSLREYALLPEIKEMLLDIKSKQKQTTDDYVFTWPDGRLMRPDYIPRMFGKILEQHGLKRMRFHDLRHSTVSILYDKGWDIKDIQMWVGHADIQTTGNWYLHIEKARKNRMARNLENSFVLHPSNTDET